MVRRSVENAWRLASGVTQNGPLESSCRVVDGGKTEPAREASYAAWKRAVEATMAV